MSVLKGIYHNGIVEMIESPKVLKTSEVYVIFPELEEKVKNKIKGFLYSKKEKLGTELIIS
jgi:hypothetical protein